VPFSIDNEPYRGRLSVFQFDQMILVAMEQNAKIAPWTHGKTLSGLQRAATELIPHGFSIALSIRELVRQGYLVSAEILLRPLIERAAVLSYLCEHPEKLTLWEAGWPHKSRPNLATMLRTMKRDGPASAGNPDPISQLVKHFNALVHADPAGARHMAAKLADRVIGYSASMSLADPEKCDEICFQAQMYLIVLFCRAIQVFPEALESIVT
jgi:hypothetical protein